MPYSHRGLTGVQEFFTSGTFTVPRGVAHVMLTMWGAGGGGGAGISSTTLRARLVVLAVEALIPAPVTPGMTYNVILGLGGTGAVNPGDNSADGGDGRLIKSRGTA